MKAASIDPVANEPAIELSCLGRCARIALAFAGTAAYALSFGWPGSNSRFDAWACPIAWAAALSWPILGLVLIHAGWNCQRAFDLCLYTMTIGMPFLLMSALVNIGGKGNVPAHVVLLVLAGAMMTCRFLRYGGTIRAWLIGLQAPFVAMLVHTFVIQTGGFR